MSKKNESNEIAALFDQYVMNTYAPTVPILRASGSRVWDDKNSQYLDFTAGIAVLNVGHTHPKVVAAIQEQAQTMVHCSNLYYNVNQALLAQKLSKLSLGGKCFFCNSGAEANEAMVKLARLWGHDAGKYEVVTMRNSFHGRTLGMIAATGQSKVQKGFDPLPLGFAYAEFNDLESVEAAINEHTVAVMLEAVQGEGGVIPATPEFLRGVRTLCDGKGILMLCDEVQCGMGRTGNWFGWQMCADAAPDAFSLAKAIASGVPMGALVASPKLSGVFTPGTHASTFGGNPLACAAALATIAVIEEEGLLQRATEAGDLFRQGLQVFVDQYEQVLEVRGVGLMCGLVVEGEAREVVDACRDMGLLCCVAGPHTVRFIPPLNVNDADMEEALDMLADALEELYGDGGE
ncbi:MAG: aspartate aminotransferase family protein [Kiritimatiellia bacterium]|jgi:acetylornithine/N-succinyldiaminopimelate aminotransferase